MKPRLHMHLSSGVVSECQVKIRDGLTCLTCLTLSQFLMSNLSSRWIVQDCVFVMCVMVQKVSLGVEVNPDINPKSSVTYLTSVPGLFWSPLLLKASEDVIILIGYVLG